MKKDPLSSEYGTFRLVAPNLSEKINKDDIKSSGITNFFKSAGQKISNFVDNTAFDAKQLVTPGPSFTKV